MIDVREVGVSFGGVKALDKISFSCDAGSIVGVVGPAGAGKSTLFDALSGRHPLVSGSMLLSGASIAGLAPHVIARRGLARMYQEDRLFGRMTVLDNALVGAYLCSGGATAANAARLALDAVGLNERTNAHVRELEPGERRRLALARALATDAQALALDEPLRSLDASERDVVRAVLRRAATESRRAVLIADRDIETCAGLCDSVLVLHAGMAIASGSFDAVVRDVDVRDAYLGVEWRQ